ncbi:hypothetical protein [Listeria booriae]|uniref:hypothetical protein n=1 Tax=Listeria booriae TaxID=1552123 RepID=UPI0016257A31|nr:hypothetical protein [Listeria booriae]MBC2322550.1 hypothetical protein [Listeria booriae]MCD2206444.1 hypothetical protein [Listeria booriae]
MSNLIPDYTENVIVAVVVNEKFSWYITDKEIWYLDYEKRLAAFKKQGFEINISYIDESRKNCLVLDTANASSFLFSIKVWETSTNHLKEMLIHEISDSDDKWKYDYRPSIYVNFDERIYYSMYSEPASYEEYVPEGWKSAYKNFYDLIPIQEAYWLDSDSGNLLI